jgi:hypothetical protein
MLKSAYVGVYQLFMKIYSFLDIPTRTEERTEGFQKLLSRDSNKPTAERNEDRLLANNVTLSCVRATIVVVEKLKVLHIVSVCL